MMGGNRESGIENRNDACAILLFPIPYSPFPIPGY